MPELWFCIELLVAFDDNSVNLSQGVLRVYM